MGELHDLARLRGLDHGEDGLRCRHAPSSGVVNGLVVDHRLVHLVDLPARIHGRFAGDFPHALIVVDEDAARPDAHVAPFAGDDDGAGVAGVVEPCAVAGLALDLTAEVAAAGPGGLGGLELLDLDDTTDAQVLLVGGLVAGAGAHLLADLDDALDGAAPRGGAVDVAQGEVAVAVVRGGGDGTVLELEVGGVVAGDGPLGHPSADLGPYVLDHAAGQEPDGVDLVRTLAEGNAAALGEVELVGRAGAQHPVGVGEECDGLELADLA